MKKSTSIIVFAVLLLAVGVGGYFVYRHFSKEDENEDTNQDNAVNNDTPPAVPSTPLKVMSPMKLKVLPKLNLG